MIERLSKYNENCILLKQIQSNRALFYKRLNNIQNFITVFVSAFLTFIGFSGNDRTQAYVKLLFKIEPNIDDISMIFNILLFLLFFIGIVHLVFHVGSKETEES